MNNTVKMVVAAIFAATGAYFRELLGPILVLVAVMLLDYISGMARAWAEKDLSSRMGVLGIVKKLLYLVAVAVAVVVDWVIQTAAAKAGINAVGVHFVGLLVAIWLILNECISILENVSALGVPIPAFLQTIIERLRQTTETEAEEGGSHE